MELRVTILLVSILAAAPALAQPRVGDPCREPEVVTRLSFDLFEGQVRRSGMEVVDRLARRLAACPDRAFELQVHTDTVRTGAFNARQSQAVAEHVRELLVERGVDGSRLVACGYGESQPRRQQPEWRGSPNERLVVRVLEGGVGAFRCPEI